MKKMKVVLSFPPTVVEEPVVYHLAVDYGVRANILRASIDPGKQGRMIVELEGTNSQVSRGLNYLERVGVVVSPLSKEIRHREEVCTSCTACVPQCPTAALDVDRESWLVSFDADKCVVCLSCLDTCIYKAIAIQED
ncbi:MAG: 4Fe-4S binding protein [Deltaproteobacteria bacterium]|nr:4Fe-4S binding protein [Deltaproteobacteria bacterium]